MTSNADVRKAHKLLDYVSQGRAVLDDEIKLLRSFLPELPKQKTLEEIAELVNEAWGDTNVNEWDDDALGHLESWLSDLEMQLRGLANTETALPVDMRLADHKHYGRVVVSPRVGPNGRYEIFNLDPGMSSGTDLNEVEPDSLTFIDAEPAKPAHPEFLETEADYQNAPEGTIVVADGGVPCHKFQSTWSSVAFLAMKDDRGMSRARRRVLRWGK